jgi:Mce-associated membrane protein
MAEKLEELRDARPDSEESTEPKVKLSKAERLEAKAARIRESEERRAAEVTAGERRPAPRGLVITTAVLGALVAALVAALVVALVSWQGQRDASHAWRGTWQHSRDANAARTEAVAAAKTFALDFGAYDYRHLDSDFSEVAARMTPDFRNSYLQSTEQLKPTFLQYKTQVTARIQGFGITSASPSNATVVVFLDQTVRTSQSSAPRIDRNRLEIQLVHRDGKWLVAKLLAK